MSLYARFLPFVGKAIAFLVAISLAWYFIAPAYNTILATVAEKLLPSQSMLTLDQGTIYIYPPAGIEPAGGIYASALHYGLVLVMALIMATPGLKLLQRLRFIAIALLAIFTVHIASIVLFARNVLSGTSVSLEQNPLIVFFAVVGSDLFPVLIWAAVSSKYFSPRSKRPHRAVAPLTTKSRNHQNPMSMYGLAGKTGRANNKSR